MEARRMLRDTLMGLTVATVLLLLVEGLLRLTGSFSPAPEPTARAPADEKDQVLAFSVRHNLHQSPFNQEDPALIFRVRPNPSLAPVGGHEGIGAHGFRTPPFESIPADARRVLLLGDSCAFGWMIPREQDTLRARLEHLLRGLPAPAPPPSVMNLAQPGYSTTQGRVLHARHAASPRPHAQVLYFGWNDVWPTPMLTDAQTLQMLDVRAQPVMGALLRSHLAGALGALVRVVTPGRAAPSTPEQLFAMEKPRVPVEEAMDNLRAMAADIPTVILVPPRAPGGRPDLDRIRPWRDALVRTRFPDHVVLVEVSAMGESAQDAHRYFTADRFHPNEQGADLLARAMVEPLRDLLGAR